MELYKEVNMVLYEEVNMELYEEVNIGVDIFTHPCHMFSSQYRIKLVGLRDYKKIKKIYI